MSDFKSVITYCYFIW